MVVILIEAKAVIGIFLKRHLRAIAAKIRSCHSPTIYLKQLRDKLELDPVRPRHFVTETGVGYRLVLED